MSRLNFSELIDAPILLSPAEAVALTLAVANAVAEQGFAALPADEELFLSSTGQVSLGRVNRCDAEDTPERRCAQLAALTRRLLQLDKSGTVDRRRRVPGGLLVVLARALGQIDLPAPTPEDFRQALERIGTPGPTTLAAVFWRAARLRAPVRPQPVSLPAVKVESALTHRGADDRRYHTPPPSELRRYLRETERELFEARAYPERRQAPSVVPPPPKRPFSSTRLWRVGSGIAATVIGAVLGTFMAFILAGSVDSLPDHAPGSESGAVVGAQPKAPAPQQAKGQRPIRTERTVQPLLLAAAVGADLFSPSFGPHGRALLFHAGRDAAPLMRASVNDTGEVEVDRIETLLDDGAANYHVTMSPDAARIAYDSDRDGVRGVYVANADGSSPHRISGSGYAAVPTWSPDGQRVAFVREEPNHHDVWNVWIADVRTGLRRRVTSHSVGQPWGASWFPDGRRLAYSLEDRLMVADLQSGLARGYRSPREGRLVRTPAVSPDGRQIVFQVQRDGVWLLDVERARMRRILADATAEEFVWLPDGAAIAYHARQGGSYGLFRLALNTSGN
jgi:Tol biopolymer transport system component